MTFIYPEMLYGLLLVPIAAGSYFRLLHRKSIAAAALGPLGAAQSISGQGSGVRRHVAPLFFLIGLTFLLIGFSRPEMAVDLPRVEGTVVLAFDVSSSMKADDLEPSRMEAAKATAIEFVRNQPATIRLGVAAFSNGGIVVQPPTYNQADVMATIQRLNAEGSTSIGQGLFSALNAIAGEPIPVDPEAMEEGVETLDIGHFPSSVIVLLTDGGDTGGPNPLVIAQLAAQAGVRIYAVGIGTQEGVVLDLDGYSVLSQLDEAGLKEIAGLTNGAYYPASDVASLQEVYENVDLQLTVRGEKVEITSGLAFAAIIMFSIGAGLSILWFGRIL